MFCESNKIQDLVPLLQKKQKKLLLLLMTNDSISLPKYLMTNIFMRFYHQRVLFLSPPMCILGTNDFLLTFVWVFISLVTIFIYNWKKITCQVWAGNLNAIMQGLQAQQGEATV